MEFYVRHMKRFDAFQTKVCLNIGLKRIETRHMTHINLGLSTSQSYCILRYERYGQRSFWVIHSLGIILERM